MPSQYDIPEADSKLGPTSSAQKDRTRGDPRCHLFWLFDSSDKEIKAQRREGTCPRSHSRWASDLKQELRVQDQSFCYKVLPGFLVLSNLPVPRCLSQATSWNMPKWRPSLSLTLTVTAPRSNLNLFISCVTVVNLAANTWPVEQLEGFRETRNLPCVGRFQRCPLGFQHLRLSPCLLIF